MAMDENMEILKKYDTSFFERTMSSFSIPLDKKQLCQFLTYYEILSEWNSFMNLTAITDFSEVVRKHFIDSLLVLKYLDIHKKMSLIDVGTGAGFPGIPLKIMLPDLQVTLLDSLKKRIVFLEEVIKRLELTGIEAIHGRAEDFAKPGRLREKYDFCVSRAVANLSTLSEYCIPFVKIGGIFVSYKSEKVAQELEGAKEAITLLGGTVKEKADLVLPGSDEKRSLLLIEKSKKTPVKFPRKAGIPAKEPL